MPCRHEVKGMKSIRNPFKRNKEQQELDKRQLERALEIVKEGHNSTIWPVYSRLGKAKLEVEVIDEERTTITNCKIVEENWLEFKHRGAKKRVIIVQPPKVKEQARRIFGIPKRERSLLFHVGADAECTHDPLRSSLDLEPIRHAINMSQVIVKSGLFQQIISSVKKKLGIEFWLPWLIIAAITVFAMYGLGNGGY